MVSRITKVVVEGLLSPDRIVSITFDSSGFAILCGDNGTGKSQLLNCVSELLKLKLIDLSRRHFSSIAIYDNRNNCLKFDRNANEVESSNRSGKERRRPFDDFERQFTLQFNDQPLSCHFTDRHSMSIRNGQFFNRHTRGRVKEIRFEIIPEADKDDIISAARTFIDDLNVCFLEADRIKGFLTLEYGPFMDEDQISDPLEILSNDVATKISSIRREMVQNGSFLSKQIDSWRAIVEEWEGKTDKHSENNETSEKLDELLKKYNEAGVLDATTWGMAKSQDDTSASDISTRILHFLRFEMTQQLRSQESQVDYLYNFKLLLERYLSNKTVVLGDHGVRFEVNGNPIPFDGLSSGERHIVMLWGRTLFIEDYKVLIIDEPEISLHPNWKERFLSDLIEHVGKTAANIIIATHSDKLVSAYYDYIQILTRQENPND